ncbi:MAG TPA: CoA-binding protein [Saprospiraceae bacterium]|nr:CoA-binding protein [Saprospiraceae bacterium]HRK80367.1 CoA-binding protein [Saprospiraceae bacterium]
MKKTLVLGASPDPSRYSYAAVHQLRDKGHEVVAVGKRPGAVADVTIVQEFPQLEDIHTVTLYLAPAHQAPMYDYILQLKPQRIIFNPGTENRELAQLAKEQGIETVQACTLVMLSVGLY